MSPTDILKVLPWVGRCPPQLTGTEHAWGGNCNLCTASRVVLEDGVKSALLLFIRNLYLSPAGKPNSSLISCSGARGGCQKSKKSNYPQRREPGRQTFLTCIYLHTAI